MEKEAPKYLPTFGSGGTAGPVPREVDFSEHIRRKSPGVGRSCV